MNIFEKNNGMALHITWSLKVSENENPRGFDHGTGKLSQRFTTR
jgi:hypothetical protein